MNIVEEKPSFVRCLDNRGYEVSLAMQGVYRREPDPAAAAKGLVRVVDETGEDYLYPCEMFEPATKSDAARPPRRRRN